METGGEYFYQLGHVVNDDDDDGDERHELHTREVWVEVK